MARRRTGGEPRHRTLPRTHPPSPISMPTLVLLRHGQSQWNLENRFTGWKDVPLSEKGRAEADEAGRRLREHDWGHDGPLAVQGLSLQRHRRAQQRDRRGQESYPRRFVARQAASLQFIVPFGLPDMAEGLPRRLPRSRGVITAGAAVRSAGPGPYALSRRQKTATQEQPGNIPHVRQRTARPGRENYAYRIAPRRGRYALACGGRGFRTAWRRGGAKSH